MSDKETNLKEKFRQALASTIRVISDDLPNLKCGDPVDDTLDMTKIPDGKASRENLYPNVVGKYMFIISIKDIKTGDELTANYNLYTYPKTGVGLQSFSRTKIALSIKVPAYTLVVNL